jgi:hypothetical protein
MPESTMDSGAYSGLDPGFAGVTDIGIFSGFVKLLSCIVDLMQT